MKLVESAELSAAEIAALEQIYVTAFPDELLAPFADLFADRMLVLLDDEGPEGPEGFALVRDLPDTTWTFLRYYAVGRRGRGFGSLMWREVCARLAGEGRTRLVWDVEDPDEAGISQHLVEEHRRRIAFYERLGGRLHPVSDYLPPHDDGHAPRLLLMDTPLADEPEPSLRDLVETVYLHRYGLPVDHPVVHRTLRSSSLL